MNAVNSKTTVELLLKLLSNRTEISLKMSETEGNKEQLITTAA